ncbi:hypothetical protein DN757_01860 [Paenibacillus silvae]|uniref:Uncharacterized protein n=2 Tax=Paenibacillus silvae TaxID=1325358 RepID=A0A2W6NNL3_9BACL|nr:hypothetical protein DN757_01860 [Paenibacillus silvae]
MYKDGLKFYIGELTSRKYIFTRGLYDMDTIAKILGNGNALELLSMVEFLFQGNMQYFIDNCKDRSNKYVFNFVHDYRKYLIEQTRYASYEDFNDTYIKNRKSSLERLFQEYLTDLKLDQLKCADTLSIYSKHVLNPEIRFSRFAMDFM